MTRVYYKEAVGAFIVFDVTRTSTFEAVQKWKKDIDQKVRGNLVNCAHAESARSGHAYHTVALTPFLCHCPASPPCPTVFAGFPQQRRACAGGAPRQQGTGSQVVAGSGH